MGLWFDEKSRLGVVPSLLFEFGESFLNSDAVWELSLVKNDKPLGCLSWRFILFISSEDCCLNGNLSTPTPFDD